MAGKFDITSIPGTRPRRFHPRRRSLAISPFTPNKATALEFVNFFTSEEQAQKRLALSSRAPCTPPLKILPSSRSARSSPPC